MPASSASPSGRDAGSRSRRSGATCRTEDAVDKTKWLARQGDPEAAVEFMVLNCIPIKMGHTGTLVTAIRYGYNGVCVRWRGEPDCLWSPRGQLMSMSADKN